MMISRRGFTLIELLIVVVIIGILATIAVPMAVNSKGRATQAAMISDLRNLATAQEAYMFEKSVYATDVALVNFAASQDVSVTVQSADAAGWSATATAPVRSDKTCALYIGNVLPVPDPAEDEGIVTCRVLPGP